MGTRSRFSKWRRHPEPPPDILSKKLRSKLLRWRRRRISPELLFSAWMKTSAVDNPGSSVVTVDSSSGGEASFNSSSRASCTKSEFTFPPEQHSVQDSRNRNDFFVSLPEPPPDILSKKLRSKLLRWRPRQISRELLFPAWMKTSDDDNPGFSVVNSSSGGEASFNSSRASYTKSEITFPPEKHAVEDSRNRNVFVSVAAEPESYADSFMKHALKTSGECSETEVSDYLPLQFVKSGSVGETTSPSYSRLLQHLNENCTKTAEYFHEYSEMKHSPTYPLLVQYLKEFSILRKRRTRVEGYFEELVLQQHSQIVDWIKELPSYMWGGLGKVAYIDTEGTVRPDRIAPIAERYGMDPGALLDNPVETKAHIIAAATRIGLLSRPIEASGCVFLACFYCSSWTVSSCTVCKRINLEREFDLSVSVSISGAVGDGITLNTSISECHLLPLMQNIFTFTSHIMPLDQRLLLAGVVML